MTFDRWHCLPLTLVLLAAGCERTEQRPAPAGATAQEPGASAPDQGPAVEAPRGLVYPTEPVTLSRGVPAAPALPVCSGGAVASYKVKPALPEGLVLDPVTGILSGTPKKVTPRAAYEVTASNRAGSVSTFLTLTVNDQAPGTAPAVTLPSFVTAHAQGLSASTKDLGEGTTYDWRLTGGTLTAGQGTSAITFQAGEEGPLTVQVKVANSGGSVAGRGEAEIVPAPQVTLSAPASVRANEDWMTATARAQAGATFEWAILPGTSGGTIVSGQGTGTLRFASNPAFGSFQIQVKVRNQAGDEAVASGTVQVVPVR